MNSMFGKIFIIIIGSIAVGIISFVYGIHPFTSPPQTAPLVNDFVEEIPTLDVCEVVSNPTLYDQRIIRIRGIYLRALENSRFEGVADCDVFAVGNKPPIPFRGISVLFESDDFEEREGSGYSELLEYGVFVGRFEAKSPCGNCPYFNYKFTVIRVESREIIRRKIV
jgi:hypothetical protein